jgi:hypothetical protein
MGDGGKGSSPRPFSVDQSTFTSNWELAFGKKDKDMQIRVKENPEEFGKCGCGRSPTGKCIGWLGLTEEQYADRKEKYETGKQDLSGKDI